MGSAGYILILCGCALWGLISGWRKGLAGQTGSLLGLAFGIVGARLILPDFAPVVGSWFSHISDLPDPAYLVGAVGALIIVGGFYLLFLLVGLVINKILKMIAIKGIDSIFGSIFGLVKWLMLLSLCYNAILSLDQKGTLFDLCDAGDGNPVEVTMMIAPAVVGYDSPADLIHLNQLKEAKSIS
jgi:uncharacterized membrane protein required for colicin V production